MPTDPGGMSGAENPPADLPEDELTLNDPLIAPQEQQQVPVDETGLPQGVEWATDDEPDPPMGSEEEEILFGDPEGLGRGRPEVDVENRRVPAKLVRRLPALKRAASDPSAPASLKAMYRVLAERLENELRG